MIQTPAPPHPPAPVDADVDPEEDPVPAGAAVYLLAWFGPLSLIAIVVLVIGALVLIGTPVAGHQVNHVFSNIANGLSS